MTTAQDLRSAMHSRALIRFEVPFEPGWTDGCVLGVGDPWFLLAVLTSQIRWDGFQCVRLQDVRALQAPAPHAEFVLAALDKRGLETPPRPRIGLTGPAGPMASIVGLPRLVTIHRQEVDPDVCWIGRVLGVSDEQVRLLQIDPDAQWHDEITEVRLSEITRLDFGGEYEGALDLVGGDPPSKPRGLRPHP